MSSAVAGELLQWACFWKSEGIRSLTVIISTKTYCLLGRIRSFVIAHFLLSDCAVMTWIESIIVIMYIFLCICMYIWFYPSILTHIHPCSSAFQIVILKQNWIYELPLILTLTVVFQATMVKVGWKRSRTWQPRRASVLPTLVRYSGQDNHRELSNINPTHYRNLKSSKKLHWVSVST